MKHVLISIDTETGGLNPLKHSLLILALSTRIFDTDTAQLSAPLTSLGFRVRWPEYVVTASALRINGIDLQEHDQLASDPEDVERTALTYIERQQRHMSEGSHLFFAAHHARFDEDFLNAQLPALGRKVSRRIIDTRSLAMHAMLHGAPYEDASLEKVSAFYGRRQGDVHEALVDTELCGELVSDIRPVWKPEAPKTRTVARDYHFD
ncbi:3'-5' exonuclease [Deinococcus sp. 6YEL10]|uniref:3'-5' exonuclease n=1 Tax=Deinococcus sp. 6YEL10 TaxID=2745870 RepID=UPI001E2E1703|nr:3'-5' exonuclease [Deinococcus sp. 6YEL10]MCD0159812.1 3'-5' exonuclease [Deinococcus sp. 6YEL10]